MAETDDSPSTGPAPDPGEEELSTIEVEMDDVPQLDAHGQPSDSAPSTPRKSAFPGRRMESFQEEGSELGSIDAASVDALPRRGGSPIDSVLSGGPDDTPSIQVR